VPISTRLQGILAMRRTDPEGEELPADAYVFGDEIGQRVRSFKRAWQAAVLRAHGYVPQRVMTIETRPDGTKRKRFTAQLTPASRAQFKAINLHFHDLRREAGSRWLDGGVPLQVIRDWLGHANISQTSTYLESTFASQHDAMRQYEIKLQRIATEGRKGDHNPPFNDTDANRKPPEHTEKHH
jgi:integrase